MPGGRGHGNHEVIDERVPDRIREAGKLVVEGPLLWASFRGRAVCGRGSSSISSRRGDVSSESCFEAVGDATRVMAGWFDDDDEAGTAHAGPRGLVPASRSRNVSPSMAFLLPLPPLMTLFRLPYAD
jgi:hypothetical protein